MKVWRAELASIAAVALAVSVSVPALPAQAPVTVQVDISRIGKKHPGKPPADDKEDVAVWLTSLDHQAADSASEPGPTATIVQEDKTFIPHVTVIRIGTAVKFPNNDPFFHNVFSLYNGKRFDLGLYESGTSKTLRFLRPGVSYLFCNIHENMSAVVIAVDTPYFGVSDRAGAVLIEGVPDGRYTMHVFYERSSEETLKGLERIVTISGSSRSIGEVRVEESPDVTLAHRNKYGEDYVPPPSSGYGP